MAPFDERLLWEDQAVRAEIPEIKVNYFAYTSRKYCSSLMEISETAQ
jgi:hypothetical protein